MANTGGTIFPGTPAGPKGVPAVRFLNRASGKMETAKQMHDYRASGAARALGAPKGGERPVTQKQPVAKIPRAQSPTRQAPAQGGSRVFNPGGVLSPPETGQIESTARNQAAGELNAVRAPLQGQAREIEGGSQRAQQAFQGYGQTQNALLGTLGDQAAQSAKTAENHAAELALQTGKSIETSGQNAQTLNGGFLDPSVQAQLNAEGSRAAGMGAAGASFAANQGQNENNFMSNLRATAAAKVTEGTRGIASAFDKQLQPVRARETEAIAKQAPNESKLMTQLAEKAFADMSVQNKQKLEAGYKAGQLRLGQQRIGATERGQNIGAETAAAGRQQKAREGELNRQFQAAKQKSDQTWKELHPGGKSIHAPSASSEATGKKYMSELSRAEQVAREHLGNQANSPGRQAAVRKYLANAYGGNGDVISAAMNLAVYGVLGPKDRETAQAYGLTEKLRPAWFKPHK